MPRLTTLPELQRTAFWMLILLMIGYFMIIAKSLLIPFVIALFVWYLINALANTIGKISVGGRKLPRLLSYFLAIVILLFFVENMVDLLVTNVVSLSKDAPLIVEKVGKELDGLLMGLGVEQTHSENEFASLLNFGTTFLSSVAKTAGDTVGFTLAIFLYVAFLLAEQGIFSRKMTAMIHDPIREAQARQTLAHIAEKIRSYLLVKSFISLVSAVLSYILLKIVGVPFAELWAVMVFLLNFIPYIGSFLSMLLPALMALVHFDTPAQALIVGGGLTGVSSLVANILEPRMMGQSLNMSPLVILLSMTVWGAIWGIAGMILAIPMTVILMIICAQYPQTRNVAILLSNSGNIEVITTDGIKQKGVVDFGKEEAPT